MFFGGSSTTPKAVRRENQSLTQTAKTRSILSVHNSVDYDEKLSFYIEPPTETISLLEFRDLGARRLDLLRKIEGLKEKYPNFDEFRKGVLHDIDVKELRDLFTLQNLREDRISHFILRLAFCQSPEQTKWFIQQELELFKLRFERLTAQQKSDFLIHNRFNLVEISSQEKENLRERLVASNIGLSHQKLGTSQIWKVYFTEALDLVKNRKVYLSGGYLHISYEQLIIIVASRFRMNMATAMAREFKHLGFIQEEDRLLPLLKALTRRGYSSKEYKAQNAKDITPDMVDELASASFPLCMRQIHSRLRTDHHLRHFARRQYGLFLKGAGMSLESSLAFFRDEFTKKMDDDKYNKQYTYNIRHQYGKEGRHVESQPFDCAKIILTNPPAAQDCHGCPYRHSDSDSLAQKLERMGITRDQVSDITELTKINRYDKACTRFFEYTHKMPEGGLGCLITHPNQYFDLSRQIHDGKRSKDVGHSQLPETATIKLPTSNSLPSEQVAEVENLLNDENSMDVDYF